MVAFVEVKGIFLVYDIEKRCYKHFTLRSFFKTHRSRKVLAVNNVEVNYVSNCIDFTMVIFFLFFFLNFYHKNNNKKNIVKSNIYYTLLEPKV